MTALVGFPKHRGCINQENCTIRTIGERVSIRQHRPGLIFSQGNRRKQQCVSRFPRGQQDDTAVILTRKSSDSDGFLVRITAVLSCCPRGDRETRCCLRRFISPGRSWCCLMAPPSRYFFLEVSQKFRRRSPNARAALQCRKRVGIKRERGGLFGCLAPRSVEMPGVGCVYIQNAPTTYEPLFFAESRSLTNLSMGTPTVTM